MLLLKGDGERGRSVASTGILHSRDGSDETLWGTTFVRFVAGEGEMDCKFLPV